jgi:RNA polymerase sigma factor (sigma-70 family)
MAEISAQTPGDEQLIRSLAAGDSATIRTIYKTCYPTIEKMVFKLNGNLDDAYDTFQDAVTIMYEKAKGGQLQLTCQFSTYLTAIAKNLWLKKLANRKNRSVAVFYDELPEAAGIESDVQVFLQFEQHVGKLDEALQKIGEPCKSVLLAFYVQNKSMTTIAEQLGYTNAENAKTQKYKCLNRLRKLFFIDTEQENSKKLHERAH